jgi:hypothetical protein
MNPLLLTQSPLYLPLVVVIYFCEPPHFVFQVLNLLPLVSIHLG